MHIQHTSIDRFRKLRRCELIVMALLFVAAFTVLNIATAHAEVTFAASVTNANGELRTVLTWDAPGASGCVGAGHASWNGAKSAAGTQALPAITLSGMYQLTLMCTFAGDTTATVSWTNTTTNTDGTNYANPAGVRIVYGQSASAMTQTVEIPNPTATQYVFNGLAPGTWFFAAKHYNVAGVESALSNLASKTITAATNETAAVSLTVNPIPGTPSGVAVR